MNDIDKYIAGFPDSTKKLLKQLRITVKKAAPEAQEIISYSMPAYKLHGVLLYFAAFEHHIGFYPGTSGIEAYKTEISAYKTSKGTVQFPLDKPLPISLITKITKFRVKENLEKAKNKSKKKLRRR